MDKKELGALIAEKFGLTKKDGVGIVEFVFDNIAEVLVDRGEVAISGFGKFAVKESAARQGFNPQTKEVINIPAKSKAVLKPAKVLKDKLA